MNEYDSNRIYDLTNKIGYVKTKEISNTDCYVINTCHIREKATDKVLHDVGRLKKEFRYKKKPILIIAGCVAQAEGEIILKKEKYVDAIVGPQSYHLINNIIKDIENKKIKTDNTEFDVIEKFDKLRFIKNSNSKISSFLTIQEGCDKFCKFCVVPYTRGPEHSRIFNDIVEEAKQLVLNGSKEITLLGQNVNAYEYKNKRLSDLIYKLDQINGLKRIRYTTSHPKDMTEDLIDAHKNSLKLMPLLHLPVQSGSTKILKEMGRKHTIKYFLEVIEKLRGKNPLIKFSSDFIIAFPGESSKDFRETLSIMSKIKFINSYSFIYSPRPGTPAAKLNTIDINISKNRLKLFQNLADSIKSEYKKKLINTAAEVLFENKIQNKMEYFGRDKYYNSVIVPSKVDLVGQTKKVSIIKSNNNTLFGKIDITNTNIAA